MSFRQSNIGGQFAQNQVIGSIVAAVLKTQKYKRATAVPSGYRDGEKQRYTPDKIMYRTVLPVHAITQEEYDFQADATQHPVESGSMYSDHVIIKPLRLSVTFEVSNFDGIGKQARFAKDSLETFKKVFESREPIGLQTTHMLLPNMVMISFQPVNSAPEWGKLTIRAVFQQVNPVTLQSQQFPSSKVQGDSTGNSIKQLGTQPATPLTAVSAKKLGKKSVKVVTGGKTSVFKDSINNYLLGVIQ